MREQIYCIWSELILHTTQRSVSNVKSSFSSANATKLSSSSPSSLTVDTNMDVDPMLPLVSLSPIPSPVMAWRDKTSDPSDPQASPQASNGSVSQEFVWNPCLCHSVRNHVSTFIDFNYKMVYRAYCQYMFGSYDRSDPRLDPMQIDMVAPSFCSSLANNFYGPSPGPCALPTAPTLKQLLAKMKQNISIIILSPFLFSPIGLWSTISTSSGHRFRLCFHATTTFGVVR